MGGVLSLEILQHAHNQRFCC